MIHDDFIKENISSINKNKIMVIDVGTNVSDTIFTNKHTHQKIKKILSTLYHNPESSIKIHNKKKVKSYFINNVVLEMYDTKINNYSYHVSKTNTRSHNALDYKVSILDINNSPNITSNYTYDMIESSIETIIQYNNILDIVITQFTEQDSFYRFTIKIKKPLEYTLLIKEIETILSLFT